MGPLPVALVKLLTNYLRALFMTGVIFSVVSLISIFLINTIGAPNLGRLFISWFQLVMQESLDINFDNILEAFWWTTLIIFGLKVLIDLLTGKKPTTPNPKNRLIKRLVILLVIFLTTAATLPLMSLAEGTTHLGMLMVMTGFAMVGATGFVFIFFIDKLEHNIK